MRWRQLLRVLTVDDSILDERFVLTPYDGAPPVDRQAGVAAHRGAGRLRMREARVLYGESHQAGRDRAPNTAVQPDAEEGPAGRDAAGEVGERADDSDKDTGLSPVHWRQVYGRRMVRPISFVELGERAARRTGGGQKRWEGPIPNLIQHSLAVNRLILETLFSLPENKDLVIRDFRIGGRQIADAMVVFIDGLVDKATINNDILEPLMLLSRLEPETSGGGLMPRVKDALLPGNQVMEFNTWKEAAENILAGSTVLFVEGVSAILSVETKGWEHRIVGAATVESVVHGPHDAFTESFRANTGLVRSKLRSTALVTEIMQVGEVASTDIAVMYMKNIANPRAVREVKRRIQAIKADYLPDSGLLEQFIEDSPFSLVPKILSTERPDRVAYGLTEGQVAVFVGHSPFVLLLPAMIWSLLQSPEDAYLRFPFGAFLRVIRLLSMFTALLLPALYIAVANYHPEMIPTDLMLAIAASRERVPFPVVVEVLIMEFSIELIREAGIRIPTVIGPTIGIVGALILGQAAVAAGIISPLLIIVVAVTALGSFAMPNYNLSFSIRLLRFFFIILAATFGFFGITLGLMALLMHLATIRSLGVPILSPVAPRRASSPDSILRGQVFRMETRPGAYWPKRTRRQDPVTRPWDPATRDSREARAGRRRGQRNQRGGGAVT